MSDNKRKRTATIIRRIARIWSIASIAFLLMMTIPQLFSPHPANQPNSGELVGLFFFPLGVLIGLIIAWKWEGAGGIITLCCIIGFHVTMLIIGGNLDLNLFIDGVAFPGLLFLIYWFLSRGRLEEAVTD